ncbi:MAG: PD40 domain-containing protein [Chloroflexi bacterium]|nr:PD40 domain-containing protein [Chloroflexota bacterium]
MDKLTVEKQLHQAESLLKAERRAEAVKLLVPIIKEDRDNIAAWRLFAQAVDKPEHKERALKELKRLGADELTSVSPARKSPPKQGAAGSGRQTRSRKGSPLQLILIVALIAALGVAGVLFVPSLLESEGRGCPRASKPMTGILYTADLRDWDNDIVLLDPANPDEDEDPATYYKFANTYRASELDLSQASWSPDGTQIVFSSIRAGSWLPDVYIGSAEPVASSPFGELCRVTFDGDNAPPEPSTQFYIASYFSWGNYPRWAPDSTQIVFNSQVTGDFELYTIGVDGENRRRLTDSPGRDMMADWSPDGTQIVFASERDGDFDLYLMDVDGSNLRQVTDMPQHQVHPRWSPDGTRIAFTSTECSIEFNCDFYTKGDVYVYNIADGSMSAVAQNPDLAEFQPAWSPDGTQLVYIVTDEYTRTFLYTVSADGSSEPEELLIGSNVREHHPDWR